MSLQVEPNIYNNINQYVKYGTGFAEAVVPNAAGSASDATPVADSSQGDKLLKKIGVIECTTCRNRKYVDGSDDPGVSFKAPAHISPESSGTAVAAHEQEHVSREGTKAQAEGREIVAQSVQIYMDVCPECGRTYASGGKTTTTTRSDNKKNDYFMDNMREFFEKHYGKYIDKKV